MALEKINRSVVSIEPDGKLALIVTRNGEPYATLVSNIIPKCKADVNLFISRVLGETTVTKPQDYKEFENKK